MTTVPLPLLVPRERVPGGCCEARVEPDIDLGEAGRLASTFKALADPTRLRIVDALRKASPEAICQCELRPLFQITQQALSKHMKLLVGTGVVGSERRGLWTYYFLTAEGLEEASAWLT